MDVDKSMVWSESAIAAEQAADADGKRICLNCDTSLTDIYCPHCGQKDLPRRHTMGDLFINFISSFWSFESKFLNTSRLILFKTGQLAKDYNGGRRERYFHPARMYVFISFVFFLLASLLPDPDSDSHLKLINRDTTNDGVSSEDAKEFNTVVGDYQSVAKYDSVQMALPPEKRHGSFTRFFARRAAEVNEKYQDKNKDFMSDFSRIFSENVPRVFFILLPVFALLFKLLYIKRDYYYSEHLIFTVYYYNFFFLTGSLYMVLNQIPVVEKLNYIIGAWIIVNLLVSMKTMYNQSWRKTVFKFCTFLFIFSLCIVAGLFANTLFIFLVI